MLAAACSRRQGPAWAGVQPNFSRREESGSAPAMNASGSFRHCVALCKCPCSFPDLSGGAVFSSNLDFSATQLHFFRGPLSCPESDIVQRKPQNQTAIKVLP
jgi:hypothetical protein